MSDTADWDGKKENDRDWGIVQAAHSKTLWSKSFCNLSDVNKAL